MTKQGSTGNRRALCYKEVAAIKTEERIPVYILFEHGRAVCICHAGKKLCRRNCERDTVTRDKYEGWKETLYRNRYGK